VTEATVIVLALAPWPALPKEPEQVHPLYLSLTHKKQA